MTIKKENNVKPKPFHPLINIFHYIFVLVFILLILNVNVHADQREVRVGVYANKPLVYQDENGEHKGLSIDVLRSVASRENWKLEFVPCSWSECLEVLKRGENDIQVIIAKTPEREIDYDFTNQSLYSLWAQVFIHPHADIESWTDLKGKNVAVYKDDLFSETFKKLIRGFDIKCNLLEVEDYQSMLNLLKEHKADAGVFVQTFAEPYAISGIVRRTPIMFNPVPIYYAFPKGKVPELVTAIDRHMKMLKEDKDSIYYSSLENIFVAEKSWKIPDWMKWTLAVATSLMLLFLFVSMVLRRQVNAKTFECSLKNKELEIKIAELEQVEEEILRSKILLESSIESPSDMIIFSLDRECRYLYFNKTHAKSMEHVYDTHPRLGDCIFDYIKAKDDIEKLKIHYDRAMAGEGHVAEEEFGEGQVRYYYEVRYNPICDDNNVIIGVTVFAQNITGRKQAEESLAQSTKESKLLAKMLHDSSQPFALVTPDGRLIRTNPAFCKLIGYTEEELLNYVTWNNTLTPPEYRDYEAEILQALMSTGESRRFEKEYIRKDGTRIYVELLVGREVDAKGDLEYLYAFVNNITERKKAEKELQKMHKLESVGILAGGIAHDFNNLLAAIRNNAYLSKILADRNGEIYENMESIENIIRKATSLTQQLLIFAKGGSPVKKTASIVEIIKESAEFVLKGSNVEFEYNVADNISPVDVDEGQMNQVIHNLILNAAQSMPQGGSIRISSENVELDTNSELPLQEGRYVKVTIQDHGVGIQKDHLKSIFDPYFTSKEMGRGLGLSITYSIINSHDGHISVVSELGTGTTFSIYLPASEKQVEEKGTEEDTFIAGQGKILIMDDEEVIRKTTEKLLTLKGYKIECAKDGDEAIVLYKKAMEASKPFDAVILDLTVRGGMGGEDAVKKLREIDPEVKAIVSSGYSNNPVLSNFREYGFCGVFAKHDEVEELGKTLRKVIVG